MFTIAFMRYDSMSLFEYKIL